MKVAILCGGLGTRLTEETAVKPKPMVEIGGQPILWHIMKIFSARGCNEFVLALGYKGEVIKDYFINYHYRVHDLTVRLPHGSTEVHGKECENWTVHLLDTGPATNTGGRVRQAGLFIGGETFLLTYGDGVADINIQQLLEFHRRHGKLVTVTAVRPPARFGGIVFAGDLVSRFAEKPQVGEGWINGGFFVIEPGALEYIKDDATLWEGEPMERLAADGQLAAYRHEGFWHCMDTLRDVRDLENLWQSGKAAWKVWG
ncbi:glucose-1-phosphate cytidylyltransferase [candidate division WOR-3 bacterium]|uniref:Glucose-1-phosphate cytidylyltransferase n=1 Tax=candidate division WOR-3 bacterium TaxID=2052148 RepID=A0A937XJN5_UNCW3|nr:glucose-1-phosphate cytidylyltransferase [candidate division WOR-3 bacterium]